MRFFVFACFFLVCFVSLGYQPDTLLNRAEKLLNNKQHDASNKILFSLIESARIKKDNQKLAKIYYLIASNFDSGRYYEKSLRYIDRSLHFSHKANDSLMLAKAYSVKAGSYIRMYDFQSANFCIEKALLYVNQSESKVYYQARMMQSNVLINLERYQAAIEALKPLAEFCIANNLLNKLDGVYYNFGLCNEYLGKHAEALRYYRLALQYVTLKDDVQFNESSIFAGIMLTHAYLGTPDSVVFYHEKYLLCKDAEFERRKSQELLDVEAKYETARREKLIAKQGQRIAEMDAKQAENRLFFVVVVSIVAVAALILLIVARVQRQKRMENEREIARKNQELEELVLAQEHKTYKAQLAGETAERKRIASELHDRLGGILATINLNLESSDEHSIDELRKRNLYIRGLLRTSIEEVREISHNLYRAGTTMGFRTNLEQLAEGLNLSGKIHFQLHYELVDLELSEVVVNELFKVIQELVTNTLKHAKATAIELQLSRIDDELQVIFEDDGVGMTREKVQFGLGLKNIQDRVQRCNGLVIFDAVPNRGTTVVIHIPI